MRNSIKCEHNREWPLGFPTCFGFDDPSHYFDIAPKDRPKRVTLGSDQCIVDDKSFFVLGCLDIPLLDTTEVFRWMIWVSLSEKTFKRMSELWHTSGRESESPYFGWLSTSLPCYPETLNLKTHVHTQPVGTRPSIELEPTDHPLAIDQRSGISLARAHELSQQISRQMI
ncbi:DUF2199 domain-containing protein [Pedosphaera parvula]|uniref:DUF2199 domain-containing protein n=1 Tax=Pedosphaera parvula (strain Ellin514) TaxID=320771 RepID=B9XHV6_PEDPL|nr:DUF2199 domain-containing protein [Pedosphaera parvula]EEF60684.1 conserved hypothetical protein [Pedosphaera parvula Ellin514]